MDNTTQFVVCQHIFRKFFIVFVKKHKNKFLQFYDTGKGMCGKIPS